MHALLLYLKRPTDTSAGGDDQTDANADVDTAGRDRVTMGNQARVS